VEKLQKKRLKTLNKKVTWLQRGAWHRRTW